MPAPTPPTPSKTWTISPNNQIVFTSLNQVVADILLKIGGVVGQLASAAVACKGSSDGTSAAMDGTNRWISNANTSTRATSSGGAMSWIVFTLASGVDVLFAYQSFSDDAFDIAFSPGGLYAAAGTATHRPVASDEQILNPFGSSVVNATASADRRLHMWIDSTKKLIRYAVYRQNAIQTIFGVETFSPTNDGTVTVIARPTWGFFYTTPLSANQLTGNYSGSFEGGLCKAVVSSVVKSLQLGCSYEQFCGSIAAFNQAKPQVNGAVGYAAVPLGLATINDTAALGKIGIRFDWWQYQDNSALDGDTSDSKEFFLIGTQGCCMWPWDGVTAPINT